MSKSAHLLLLAGTIEARKMASHLAKLSINHPDIRVTASLAGITTQPTPLDVPTRIGGFGGVAGLTNWMISEKVTLAIDMTHPYATQMSAHATQAALSAGVKLIQYHRPPWQPEPLDEWRYFESWQEMIDAVPVGAHIFAAGGSKMLSASQWRDDITVTARALVRPDGVPEYVKIILSLPHQTVAEEVALLQLHKVSHIFCKNSGGTAARAKIDAARALGLPVWMLSRPTLPDMQPCHDFSALLNLIEAHLAGACKG